MRSLVSLKSRTDSRLASATKLGAMVLCLGLTACSVGPYPTSRTTVAAPPTATTTGVRGPLPAASLTAGDVDPCAAMRAPSPSAQGRSVLSVRPATARTGDAVQVSGSGFVPGAEVTVWLGRPGDEPITRPIVGRTVAAAGGLMTLDFVVPHVPDDLLRPFAPDRPALPCVIVSAGQNVPGASAVSEYLAIIR